MKTAYTLLFYIGLAVAGWAIMYGTQPVATLQFLIGAIIAWLAWLLRDTEKA